MLKFYLYLPEEKQG